MAQILSSKPPAGGRRLAGGNSGAGLLSFGAAYRDELEKLLKEFKDAGLASYVTKLLAKRGEHVVEFGDVFLMMEAAARICPRLVLSKLEKTLADIEARYRFDVKSGSAAPSAVIEEFFANRPANVSDDMLGRLLDRIHLFGCDEFFYLVARRLGHDPGFSGFLLLPPDYCDTDLPLGNLGARWIMKMGRETVARVLKNGTPVPGGFRILFRGFEVRLVIDEGSTSGSYLDTEKLYDTEFKEGRASLEALATGRDGKPLRYGSQEEALAALSSWALSRPFLKLKTGKKLGECVKPKNKPKVLGRSVEGSRDYIIAVRPCHLAVKTSAELGIPFFVVATDDMASPPEEILKAYEAAAHPFAKSGKGGAGFRAFTYGATLREVTVTIPARIEALRCALEIAGLTA